MITSTLIESPSFPCATISCMVDNHTINIYILYGMTGFKCNINKTGMASIILLFILFVPATVFSCED